MKTTQSDFFAQEHSKGMPNIPGLSYLPDYVSIHESQNLLSIIDQQEWLSDLKRRVQHYGYKYDYKARAVTPALYLGPVPEWLQPLCTRLYAENIFTQNPDQVIVNEYLPGQGISAHIDCVPCFGDTIASLSLGSSCIMALSNTKTGEKHEILLEPQSLIVFSGPARYDWQHAIPPRKSDMIGGMRQLRERRVSLTFRKVIV